MLKELNTLLSDLRPSHTDTIVFVGDLIDKGPDSLGVVSAVRKLSERCNVVVVEGNHEDKHRRFRRNLVLRPEIAQGQADRSPELAQITADLTEDDINFLDSAVPFHRIEEHNVLVVHAGIPGNMVTFPETVEEVAAMSNKARKIIEKTARVRHVNVETGKFIKLGDETEADPFWADVFDGRFGHVVFGHEPFTSGVAHFDHATGIDTGAVFGGFLTAMVIEENGSRSFVSIPSREITTARGGA